ncbi:MAG: hypothetical protein A4E26_02297 [Methanobacterium sp. PtaU1.Bin097]|jgi:uncharacterized protein (DUF1786 family)|nr:MAG: hypothetical protein A4E26_02297 [Methanobacterium sp. PtaU1.Bin097]
MRILTLDVGAGTQDVMLYDSEQPVENSYKMVLPSPTRIFAEKIRKHHNDLFLSGETMGGGSINKAIKNHLEKGYRVLMTENAARTVRDDLNRVKWLGIEIIPSGEMHPEISQIELKDVDLEAIREAFDIFGVELEFDYIAVAVQDHGYSEGMGDRNFRFSKIKEKLESPQPPEVFAYSNTAPDYFTRMNGVLRTLKGYNVVIMDSKFASICGATCDEYVKDLDSFIALDVGNGHTLAASFKDGKIMGVFEHHTGMLTPDKITRFCRELAQGTLSHEQIHEDGGHGAWVAEPIGDFQCLVATGPKRGILKETSFKVHNAAPAGDVMMAGPSGLVKAVKYIKK